MALPRTETIFFVLIRDKVLLSKMMAWYKSYDYSILSEKDAMDLKKIQEELDLVKMDEGSINNFQRLKFSYLIGLIFYEKKMYQVERTKTPKEHLELLKYEGFFPDFN